MNPMTLTLLRHGESTSDIDKVYGGSYDDDLTELGRAQAAALGVFWAQQGKCFDAIWCSTLKRAVETARLVTEPLGLTPTPSDLLREHDSGPLGGIPLAEVETRYPRPIFKHRFDPFTKDGGESDTAFEARALLAMEQIWSHGGDQILVVAHGGMNNALLSTLTHAQWTAFAFSDTSFATVQISRESDVVRLMGLNQAPHLPLS